ncbi:hypothetical protein L9F63_011025, partial [Diploptera punctata]
RSLHIPWQYGVGVVFFVSCSYLVYLRLEVLFLVRRRCLPVRLLRCFSTFSRVVFWAVLVPMIVGVWIVCVLVYHYFLYPCHGVPSPVALLSRSLNAFHSFKTFTDCAYRFLYSIFRFLLHVSSCVRYLFYTFKSTFQQLLGYVRHLQRNINCYNNSTSIIKYIFISVLLFISYYDELDMFTLLKLLWKIDYTRLRIITCIF